MNPLKRENIDINTVENPNISVSWDNDALDRMEGSVIGKNKSLNMQNKTTYTN